MSSFARKSLKFTQGLGYGTLTIAAGVGTLVLATATVGLFMTGIGAPVGIVTGAGTIGCGAGTILAGKRTGHKFFRAFEKSNHSHHDNNGTVFHTSLHHVNFDKNRIQGHGSEPLQDPAHSGSSKPFFSPPPVPEEANAQLADNKPPVIDNITPVIGMTISA